MIAWWCLGAVAVTVCVALRYTFRDPPKPVEIIEKDSIGRRMAFKEQIEERLRHEKYSISPDLLEIQRKAARAERIESVYCRLVVDIKERNIRGHRRLDAGHPCEHRRDTDYFLTLRARPYLVPLTDSALAEIAESNALGEEVAERLRHNGIGVDTSGKMAYGADESNRALLQNRMIISW